MLRKAMDYIGEYKSYTCRAILLIILGVICSIVPYIAVFKLVDVLIAGKTITSAFVLRILLVTIFSLLLHAIFNTAGLSQSHIAAYYTLKNLRISLQHKLENMPLGIIQKKGTGGLKKMFIDDIEQLELLLAHAIPEGIGNLCIPIVIYIAMFFIDWKLALLSLVSLPLGMVAMGAMFKIGMSEMDDYYKAGKEMNDIIIEYVNGMEVIKVFNRDGELYEKYSRSVANYRDFTLAWFKACWPWMALYSAIIPCIVLATLPVGSYLVLQGFSTLSNLILCICLSSAIGGPILKALSFAGKFPQLNYKIEELEKLMSEQPVLQTKDAFIGENYDITFENVTFAYEQTDVIKGVNAKFSQGSLSALVGESGSGKSTLGKLLVHFYDVKEGNIKIGGQDITKMSVEALNDLISYVSQEQFLFNTSLLENIRIGKPDASDEDVVEAARKAQCFEFLNRIEGGIHAMAGDGGKQLSGGERQRISLARAILKDAPIIVLDEATAFMDPENEAQMNLAIREVIKNKTVIVIAHHLQSIVGASNILVMKDGMVESSGTHEELLTKSREYKKLWKIALEQAKWSVTTGGVANV